MKVATSSEVLTLLTESSATGPDSTSRRDIEITQTSPPIVQGVPAIEIAGTLHGETFAFPLSLIQQRYWLFDRMVPGNPALNMPIALRLSGLLDTERLQQSLAELIQRHDALRTSFGTVEGQPVQLVEATVSLRIREVDLQDIPEDQRHLRKDELVLDEARQPFALSTSPLLRVLVVRLGSDESLLLLTLPHIVTDGWSNGIIIRELAMLYDAHVRGVPAVLPDLSIQYVDYCVWQRDWLKTAIKPSDVAYWREKLKGRLPILDLPTDRPVVNSVVSPSESEVITLPPELIDRLKSFCRQEQVTLFMFFLAVFKSILCRYSRQTDILVGSPVAGRPPETENVVGPFASSICLRTDLSGNPTFREILERVRDVTTEALEHQDLPFERLVDEVDVSQFHGRNPLFQIYFLHQVGFLQPTMAGGLTWTPLNWVSTGSAFDLYLAMLERPDGTAVRLEYKPEQFDPTTIQAMLADIRSIIDNVQSDPSVRIDELKVELKIRIPTNQRANPAVLTPAGKQRSAGEKSSVPGNGVIFPPFQAAKTRERSADNSAESAGADNAGATQFENRLAILQEEDAGFDKLKSIIVSIWEEVFGTFPIKEEDDFLALGGSSLLATRLMTRINQALDLNLPSAFLFGFPTPARLAGELRHTNLKKIPRSVVLQPLGDKAPFFIVGAATRLVELIRRTVCGHPIISLLADDPAGQEGPYELRKEAALHVATITDLQPEGPYLVGGFSAGGIVAYEVAQQLSGLGKAVALLVLFDVTNPYFMYDYSQVARFLRRRRYSIRFHAAKVKSLPFLARLKYLAQAIRRRFPEPAPPKEELPDNVLLRILAARKYRPAPIQTPTLLFKRSTKAFLGRHADPLFGWGNTIVGDFDICVLDCADHLDIFSGDNGDIVVRKLRHRLSEAFENTTL